VSSAWRGLTSKPRSARTPSAIVYVVNTITDRRGAGRAAVVALAGARTTSSYWVRPMFLLSERTRSHFLRRSRVSRHHGLTGPTRIGRIPSPPTHGARGPEPSLIAVGVGRAAVVGRSCLRSLGLRPTEMGPVVRVREMMPRGELLEPIGMHDLLGVEGEDLFHEPTTLREAPLRPLRACYESFSGMATRVSR